METTSLADVRANLSRYVDAVVKTHERVTITRNGRPAAVLISVDDLESLEETIEVLSDPQAMADIREARAEAERGDQGMPLEEFLASPEMEHVRAHLERGVAEPPETRAG